MKKVYFIAIPFILVAIIFGYLFYLEIQFPVGIGDYFKKSYYNQFGALALCVELFIAGLYLFRQHSNANFTLALFGFTVLLDFAFNWLGVFTTSLPLYATIVFIVFAIISLILAFTNSFNLGRISFWGAIKSFILGNIIELFFNYW